MSATVAFRSGFRRTKATAPAVGAATTYELGGSIDALARTPSQSILFTDSAATLPERALRRAVQIFDASPDVPGLTFGGPALRAVFGENGVSASARIIAQTLTPVHAAPPWYSLVRRSMLDFGAGYATPEFLLLDLAARAPLLRVGSAEVEIDHRAWARDVVAKSAELLARDLRIFTARYGVEKVPPQFRVEAFGELIDPQPSGAADGAWPKLSVICPVFKPDFLEAMIESVKRQSWPHWELLLIVDGPPRDALQQIEQILLERGADPRILCRSRENRGTGPTRRELGELATGDYIVSIDDDDMLHDDALATFAAAAREHRDVPLFRAGARLMGLADDYLRPRPRLVIDGITNDPFEVTQPWAIRRDVLRDLGGFEWDDSLRKAGEDTILFHKADAARLPVRLIDRPLYFRRLSTKNLSLEFEYDEALAHFQNLDKRFCPSEWRVADRRQEKLDRFQRSTTTYTNVRSGVEVVCSSEFYQYRTLGSLDDVTIDLELTTVCNAVCTFCPRDEMPDKKTFIALDVVESLAAQLRTMARPPQVVFCGIGESTLHPHLEEITRTIAGAGSRVSMTTNGAKMTTDLFRRLVAAGMTSINFSVNAATAATHEKVMKMRGYDKVVQNIDDVVAARNDAFPHVRIQVSSVVCADNQHEVERFVAFWRNRGVTQVWLHPVNNRAGLVESEMKPVDMNAFARTYLHDPMVVVDVFGERSDDDGLCKIARSLIFVSAEGETRLCAMDYRRETRYGNVRARRIDEVQVDKLIAFASGKTRALCDGCDFDPVTRGVKPAPPPPPPVKKNKYEGLFCSMPFDYAQADPSGELYLCCPQTLPRSAGNLLENDFMALWNSDAAVEMRESILDGSYRFCSEETCGVLQSGKLTKVEDVKNPRHRRILREHATRLVEGPHTINFSYDRTCNLACPSCRTDFIVAKGEMRAKVDKLHDCVTGPHLRDAERLIITGSGDPFGSRHYLKFLRSFQPASNPRLRIRLSTNGLLLDENMWESICHDAIDMIDVSIDAATQATYTLNRGGDFARLLDNLRFMASLRRRGALTSFEIHFVVQNNNFLEMPDFARLGLDLGCDMVCFKQLVNWGTFSEEEFTSRAVQRAGHRRHDEFLQLLRDPIFGSPHVYLHDLSHLRTLDEVMTAR